MSSTNVVAADAALYVTHDRKNGLEYVRDGPERGLKVVTEAEEGGGGLVCVKRSSTEDTPLCRAGLDGNVYCTGSFVAGGLMRTMVDEANKCHRTTVSKGRGESEPNPWFVREQANVVLRDDRWRVGIGTSEPTTKLHVSGGSVTADAFHGRLSFSHLIDVPVASSGNGSGSGLGLVRLTDVTMDASDPRASTTAASALALKAVQESTERRVPSAGGVMTGALRLRGQAANIIVEDGRIGIGFGPGRPPSYRLDVRGDINFTGALLRGGRPFPDRLAWEVDDEAKHVLLSPPAYFVGIGTGDPTHALEVSGGGGVKADAFVGDGASITGLHMGNAATGTLAVERGGTGASGFEEFKLLVGRGTDPVFSPPSLHWDAQAERLGLGETNPKERLHVHGNIRASGQVFLKSDARVKTDVLPVRDALERVLALRGVTYTRTDYNNEKKEVGFIAQEVERTVPEVVHVDSQDGTYSISYGNLTAVLTEAVKEVHVRAMHREQELRLEIDKLRSDFERRLTEASKSNSNNNTLYVIE
jgi:hypothetical protein